MFEKIKDWLYNKYLPNETKDIYIAEVTKLREAVSMQKNKIAELNAYIDGMHSGMRHRTKIEINNRGNE